MAEGIGGEKSSGRARWCLAAGAVSAGIGIALGALGAHSLRIILPAEALATFETGVRYQMYHAGGLLAVGLAEAIVPARYVERLRAAGWAFITGTVLFSGSLYALSITGSRELGFITPVGGVLFLAGWGLLFWAFAGRESI
jgi:uncharacterized membrane protein YgdD (TMEM256/DUF423 family)